MVSSDTIAFFSIVLTAISLIVTIVGWSITFKKQKEILEKQIEGDVAKEKISQYVKLALNDIEKIRNWIRRGYEIYRLLQNTVENTDAREKASLLEKASKLNEEWGPEFEEEIYLLATKIENRSKIYMRGKNNLLSDELEMFHNGVGLALGGAKFWGKEYDCGFYAQSKLDVLTWEILDQPIPKFFL